MLDNTEYNFPEDQNLHNTKFNFKENVDVMPYEMLVNAAELSIFEIPGSRVVNPFKNAHKEAFAHLFNELKCEFNNFAQRTHQNGFSLIKEKEIAVTTKDHTVLGLIFYIRSRDGVEQLYKHSACTPLGGNSCRHLAIAHMDNPAQYTLKSHFSLEAFNMLVDSFWELTNSDLSSGWTYTMLGRTLKENILAQKGLALSSGEIARISNLERTMHSQKMTIDTIFSKSLNVEARYRTGFKDMVVKVR